MAQQQNPYSNIYGQNWDLEKEKIRRTLEEDEIRRQMDYQKHLQAWTNWYNRFNQKPVELPDDFTQWAEEVRKQNRLEELVQKLYDTVMANKKVE